MKIKLVDGMRGRRAVLTGSLILTVGAVTVGLANSETIKETFWADEIPEPSSSSEAVEKMVPLDLPDISEEVLPDEGVQPEEEAAPEEEVAEVVEEPLQELVAEEYIEPVYQVEEPVSYAAEPVQPTQPEPEPVLEVAPAAPVVEVAPPAEPAPAPAATGYVGISSAAKEFIAMQESGGSYTASNGVYYGRYQLHISYLNGDLSPENQERVADQYALSRYGSWEGALAFWHANGWY